MNIKEEILVQMDSALRPEFDKAIDNTIERAFKEDVKTLGFIVANSIKCQWEVMKPHLFYAYCLGVKAQEARTQAVPDNSLSRLKNTITAHYDRLNDVMHQEGYSDKIFGQLMALDFVEEVIDEMINTSEPQITELKVEWASDCFKCGHHEAIIYSTAAEASTKGWFHDGDAVKCSKCGHAGEMDAQGEDTDICWDDEPQEPAND